jgi:hypothetical protein
MRGTPKDRGIRAPVDERPRCFLVRPISIIAFALVMASACRLDEAIEDAQAQAQSVDDCGEDEVVLAYFGGPEDYEECAPIPDPCGETADCAASDCVAALYESCEAPAMGVACSSGTQSTIVSCNQ